MLYYTYTAWVLRHEQTSDPPMRQYVNFSCFKRPKSSMLLGNFRRLYACNATHVQTHIHFTWSGQDLFIYAYIWFDKFTHTRDIKERNMSSSIFPIYPALPCAGLLEPNDNKPTLIVNNVCHHWAMKSICLMPESMSSSAHTVYRGTQRVIMFFQVMGRPGENVK